MNEPSATTCPEPCASTNPSHAFDHAVIADAAEEIKRLRGLVRAIHGTDFRLVMHRVRMDGYQYGALLRALDEDDSGSNRPGGDS